MERRFLSQQGSRGGRCVKEKDLNRNKKNTSLGIGVTTKSDDTMNDDNPIGVASAIQEGVTPSVVDMTVCMRLFWDKLHGVPLRAFSEDGLSDIATKLDTPLMLDSYTSVMILMSGLDEDDKGYDTEIASRTMEGISYPEIERFNPYDDDMYENHDLSEHLQSICDDLDITVRDRKKK
ncbi:hypothetical protein Tco_0989580 [Tanacetum coccineum]|uniref:Uncharacterized protein n=1 Tax=Tanacetum coccineum TaxID=301880 RepID=A0ABQ5EU01_9ASTR